MTGRCTGLLVRGGGDTLMSRECSLKVSGRTISVSEVGLLVSGGGGHAVTGRRTGLLVMGGRTFVAGLIVRNGGRRIVAGL